MTGKQTTGELREKTEKNRICWRFHTCGYGNNTTEAEHPFYASEEKALDAHGFVAARMLDMDYQAVSVSGICVMRNSGAERQRLSVHSEVWTRHFFQLYVRLWQTIRK